MAKPCRYQLPGADTWMSESEFKKALNDGLIDKYVNDGVISIPNLKPKAATTPAAPVATETAVETPATPVAETKEKGKYFIDGKEVSEEEAIKEIQDESRGSLNGFNLSGKKIEYKGSDEQAIRATEEHNKSISPVDKEGKLKSDYIDAAIKNAFNSVSFKKFGDAYRKHIDPYFSQSNRGQGSVKKGFPWREVASYVIGDGVNMATEEQFRAFAKELGLEVPTQETKTEPVAETKTESNKEKISRGADMLDKMSEEEMDNFIDDWFNDRIPREELPGGSDAIKLLEARKVAPKPMSKPKRLTIDNAFELSNEHGFIINIDGELYGLSKVEDPDATSDAEDKYGDPKEYVWVYSKIAEGIDGKTTETYTNDINEVIKGIKSSKAKTVTEVKTEPVQESKPVASEKESAYDENGSFTDKSASQIIKNIIDSFGVRQASMVAKGLRKAGFSISLAYENPGKTVTQILSDSKDLLASDYAILTKEEKAQATKVLSDIAKKLGVEVESTQEAKPVETKTEPTPVEPVAKEETPEYETTEVKPEGKTPAEIKEEYIAIAKQSNGDYAIVEGRTGNQVVYKKNRKTGRWQGLTGKGEWVDVNDEMNAKANDAVNYTRKDKKVVILGTVKNGITSNDEFVYDFNAKEWKKRSEDGYLYGIGPELAAKAEKEFLQKNPKRAPKNKEEVKQRISDFIDKAKADEGIAMSSIIPGLSPKLWNKILDLVKEAVLKGVDLTFALNDAARKVFDEAVKKGEITAKQAADFMDQLNSEKVNRDGDLSSIKNDMASELAREIASIGIENATIQEIINSAEKAIKNGEVDPNFLVKQLIKDPRPTTPLETAVLIYSKTKMLNDLDDLYRKLNDTNPNADTKAIRDKIEILESDLLQHEVATSISGSQQGLSFSLRRVMMNSEYGLFLPRIQKIYNDAGKDMPEGLKEEIEKAQKELRRLNREIETKRKQADEAKDDEAVNNIKNSSPKKGSGKKSLSKDGKVAVSIDSIRKAVSEGAKTIEEVIEAVRGEVTSTYPNATDRQIRDAISNYGREVSKTKDDLSEEVNRIRSVGRMISKLEDIQKQLATKVGKIKNDAVRTRAVKILTDRERELRRAIKEAMADIPITEEELKAFQENKLEAYKKSLNDRNKELERRIKEGDFSTKTRTKSFELDEEARKLEIERQELIEQFEYEKMRAQLAVEPDLQKVGRRLLDVFNLPKGLIASIDLSAPFRQGVIGVMSQSPIKTARQIKQMMGFWKNPETYDKWLAELKSSEFYPLIKASGLYVAEQNGKLSAMEEQFMNNLGNKIPILGQSYTVGGKKIPGANLYKKSEVAYTGFLNNMRVQSFMEGADLLKEQGYTMAANPQVFKDWAKFCNSATGRGDMNPQLAVSLSPVFFSPRLIKARLEVLGLSPLYYSRMNPAARAMALKTMGKFMASTSLIIGLTALYYNNDDDDKTSVELDPRSTDFGKIKLGNTRVDITGGMAVYYRTLAQVASGQKKSPITGTIEELNKGFGKTTRKDVAEQFFANKLAPFPSKFYQWASLTEKEKANRIAEEAGEDNAFNRMGIPVAAQDLLIPLWMRDVEPIMKEQGYGVGSSLIGLSILGQGVQYYENKYKASKSNNSMNFNFDDSEGIGDFKDAGGIGDFNDQKGMGDFN